MTLVYDQDGVQLHHGDALAVLRTLADESVSAVVTDPPYGLAEITTSKVMTTLTAWLTGDREYVPDGQGFMGRRWDRFVPPPAVWDECLRVLKPGLYGRISRRREDCSKEGPPGRSPDHRAVRGSHGWGSVRPVRSVDLVEGGSIRCACWIA